MTRFIVRLTRDSCGNCLGFGRLTLLITPVVRYLSEALVAKEG